jgi:hypothetical protein
MQPSDETIALLNKITSESEEKMGEDLPVLLPDTVIVTRGYAKSSG